MDVLLPTCCAGAGCVVLVFVARMILAHYRNRER